MKLSTLIIGLALLVSALPSYAGGIMMMGGGVASTGDSEITFYHDMNSKSTTPNKGTGTITFGASITAASDISGMQGNCLYFSGGYAPMGIPGSGNISATVGTIGFYFRKTGDIEPVLIVSNGTDSSPYFMFYNWYGNDDHLFGYMSNDNQGEIALSTETTYFVELSWDYANARLSTRVNGGTWKDVTGLTGDAPTVSTLYVGSINGLEGNYYIDQLIISNVYKKDIYAIRDNTSF